MMDVVPNELHMQIMMHVLGEVDDFCGRTRQLRQCSLLAGTCRSFAECFRAPLLWDKFFGAHALDDYSKLPLVERGAYTAERNGLVAFGKARGRVPTSTECRDTHLCSLCGSRVPGRKRADGRCRLCDASFFFPRNATRPFSIGRRLGTKLMPVGACQLELGITEREFLDVFPIIHISTAKAGQPHTNWSRRITLEDAMQIANKKFGSIAALDHHINHQRKRRRAPDECLF